MNGLDIVDVCNDRFLGHKRTTYFAIDFNANNKEHNVNNKKNLIISFKI